MNTVKSFRRCTFVWLSSAAFIFSALSALAIHPMFAVVVFPSGGLATLLVLSTLDGSFRSLFASVLYSVIVGGVSGMFVALVWTATVAALQWTDGGHGGWVHLGMMCLGIIVGAFFGAAAAIISRKSCQELAQQVARANDR